MFETEQILLKATHSDTYQFDAKDLFHNYQCFASKNGRYLYFVCDTHQCIAFDSLTGKHLEIDILKTEFKVSNENKIHYIYPLNDSSVFVVVSKFNSSLIHSYVYSLSKFEVDFELNQIKQLDSYAISMIDAYEDATFSNSLITFSKGFPAKILCYLINCDGSIGSKFYLEKVDGMNLRSSFLHYTNNFLYSIRTPFSHDLPSRQRGQIMCYDIKEKKMEIFLSKNALSSLEIKWIDVHLATSVKIDGKWLDQTFFLHVQAHKIFSGTLNYFGFIDVQSLKWTPIVFDIGTECNELRMCVLDNDELLTFQHKSNDNEEKCQISRFSLRCPTKLETLTILKARQVVEQCPDKVKNEMFKMIDMIY